MRARRVAFAVAGQRPNHNTHPINGRRPLAIKLRTRSDWLARKAQFRPNLRRRGAVAPTSRDSARPGGVASLDTCWRVPVGGAVPARGGGRLPRRSSVGRALCPRVCRGTPSWPGSQNRCLIGLSLVVWLSTPVIPPFAVGAEWEGERGGVERERDGLAGGTRAVWRAGHRTAQPLVAVPPLPVGRVGGCRDRRAPAASRRHAQQGSAASG